MSTTWETAAAAAAVSLGGYELWNAWQTAAPSLEVLRSAGPNDTAVHQQLLDAEMTVGSLALVIGVSMLVLTKNPTVLVLLSITTGALAYWYNALLQG